ncbi:MAG: RNA methyltransferase [Psychroserpens sp.]|nr:RNA methyltransferase [Psychroserpens sp.]
MTKNEIKLIKGLGQKKNRIEERLFVVEGLKSIQEFLDSSFELVRLYATKNEFDVPVHSISEQELKRISNYKSPNVALAVFRIPEQPDIMEKGLILALDDVRDPGNLGTIIRLCDWFGIEQLVCSNETVDCYNPKVVQATMGSLTRVKVLYTDLNQFIAETSLPTFGTFMDGESIYKASLPGEGVIIMGNEANGISKDIQDLVHSKIGIPRFGNLKATESLNVAAATAIILSAFRG